MFISPSCGSQSALASVKVESKKAIEWSQHRGIVQGIRKALGLYTADPFFKPGTVYESLWTRSNSSASSQYIKNKLDSIASGLYALKCHNLAFFVVSNLEKNSISNS